MAEENKPVVKDIQPDVQVLQSRVTELENKEKDLGKKLAQSQAESMARELVFGAADLKDSTRKRLVESLKVDPPVKDGELDRVAFKQTADKAIADAIEEAKEYRQSSGGGSGAIKNMGDSAHKGGEKDTPASLEQARQKTDSGLQLLTSGGRKTGTTDKK